MIVGKRIAPVRFLVFPFVLIAALAAALAAGADPRAAFLLGFDAAALVFLCTVMPLFRADADQMRRRAEDNDANRIGLLAITVLLSLVILFAVGTLIASPGHLGRADVILIVATLALAWLFANMVFTLHYGISIICRGTAATSAGSKCRGCTSPVTGISSISPSRSV